jgi:hypothetical protein
MRGLTRRYGDQDVRAPLPVAEHLHANIAGSTLVVLPGVGHVCNLEEPKRFNATVRTRLARAKLSDLAPSTAGDSGHPPCVLLPAVSGEPPRLLP